ncbi:MAG TPA: glycosyltransferase [Haloplasmataceae bacterium]
MIKVGQFNDSFLPVMDGVVNTVKNYAYWINRKYGKSYVITPSFPKYQDNEEYDVIRYTSSFLPFRKPYRLGLPFLDNEINKKLDSIDFDILHVHCPFSSGKLALKLAQKKSIPIIATFHSKFYDDFKQVFKSDYITKKIVNRIITFFERVDYVWTVNESTKATLIDYGFKKNIEIMPNGTDFLVDFNYQDNIEYMKQNYLVYPNDLMFLFVGQHIWQKNLKLVVEVLNALKQKNLQYKMFFIGEGYAKKALEAMVEHYALTENVKFMGKITDRALLQRFFARSNLFLFPSLYDNAPIVVREAAALRTPSIVINGSNAQEGIIDGYNGFTSEEDIDKLATKIYNISQDKEKLHEVGLNAQKTISCSWENIIDKVVTRYQEIINERKKILL